jgi:hypothetical protein
VWVIVIAVECGDQNTGAKTALADQPREIGSQPGFLDFDIDETPGAESIENIRQAWNRLTVACIQFPEFLVG